MATVIVKLARPRTTRIIEALWRDGHVSSPRVTGAASWSVCTRWELEPDHGPTRCIGIVFGDPASERRFSDVMAGLGVRLAGCGSDENLAKRFTRASVSADAFEALPEVPGPPRELSDEERDPLAYHYARCAECKADIAGWSDDERAQLSDAAFKAATGEAR